MERMQRWAVLRRVAVRAGAIAAASAAFSILIALTVAPMIGSTFDRNGLIICVVCSVMIGGPASAFHLYQKERLHAAHAAVQRLNAQLAATNKELAERATRDGLSGLYNRSEFYRRLHLPEYSPGGALFVIDIDDFKLVNDRNGHLVGDEAIRRIADVFTTAFPPSALIGRTGGDEFCALIPSIDEEQANQIGTRIIEDVAAIHIINPRTGEPVQITISTGYAVCAPLPTPPKQGIDLADQALYQAKRSGRGLLISHDTQIVEPVQVLAKAETIGSEQKATAF